MWIAMGHLPRTCSGAHQKALLVGILKAVVVHLYYGVVVHLGLPATSGTLHFACLAAVAGEVQWFTLHPTALAGAVVRTLGHIPVLLIMVEMPAFEAAVPDAAITSGSARRGRGGCLGSRLIMSGGSQVASSNVVGYCNHDSCQVRVSAPWFKAAGKSRPQFQHTHIVSAVRTAAKNRGIQ